MTQRKKLDLPLNQPVTIELMYDEPVTGKSNTGVYNLYAVKIDEDEYSFFAPDDVHSELSKLSKGDKASITKLAAQRGSRIVTSYEIKPISDTIHSIDQDSIDSRKQSEVSDPFFKMMLNSYKDAIEISKELNGMADPEKIAVTLFIARSKSLS